MNAFEKAFQRVLNEEMPPLEAGAPDVEADAGALAGDGDISYDELKSSDADRASRDIESRQQMKQDVSDWSRKLDELVKDFVSIDNEDDLITRVQSISNNAAFADAYKETVGSIKKSLRPLRDLQDSFAVLLKTADTKSAEAQKA